jgi:1-acyl-sn-glycerol-3-phosphate acyltransferase
MIRILVVFSFVTLFLIFSIPLIALELVIQKISKRAADISSLRFVQMAFKIILYLSGTKVTVIGEENIPTDEAVLYVPNHQSYFDIVLTYSRCPNITGFVAKDFFLRIPLLSSWMKRLYCLFLNRNDIRAGLKMILKGVEQLQNGISMCIFPEGTRNKDPLHTMPFKEGSLKMAEKSGCPIIPVAIVNTAEIFENHFPLIKPCHVILQYGEPIRIQDLEKGQRKFLGAYTRNKIQAMIDSHDISSL